eukprot:GCRY01001330.1.p1 GENE.GCRY01001330.1~~GCRY01001330.1.p1  ORF type:complete len:493 (-),score=100.55 GCRY01001330.1:103-1524(-)
MVNQEGVVKKQSVGIVGGGLSGLVAAWALARSGNEVTIFEKYQSPGFDRGSFNLTMNNGKTVHVDVPLRIFSNQYYPNLLELYKHLGITLKLESYAGSFFNEAGNTFLSWKSLLFPPLSFSFLTKFDWKAIRAGWEYFHLLRNASKHMQMPQFQGMTLGEYLEHEQYSDYFKKNLLFPTLSGICTCTYETVLEYPADVLLHYLLVRAGSGVTRAVDGTRIITDKLCENVNVQCNAEVNGLSYTQGGQIRVTVNQEQWVFDKVILATEPSVAQKLLGLLSTPHPLSQALSLFPVAYSSVVVHSDPVVMPPKKTDWNATNVMLKDGAEAPMISVWMNKVASNAINCPQQDIFETWNPVVTPTEALVHSQSHWARPVLTREAPAAWELLHQHQGQRGIFIAGAYTIFGIPLLENATVAGLQVASQIDPTALPPWRMVDTVAQWKASTLSVPWSGVSFVFPFLFAVCALVVLVLLFL